MSGWDTLREARDRAEVQVRETGRFVPSTAAERVACQNLRLARMAEFAFEDGVLTRPTSGAFRDTADGA